MSSEFIAGAYHSAGIVEQLFQGQPLQGATYNNILVSSTEPGVVDVYDRTIASTAKFGTLYWPGGSPTSGGNLETVTLAGLPTSPGAEVARIRRSILSASIGEAAIQRIPEEMQKAWDEIEKSSITSPILQLEQACRDYSLPLVVCTTSEITNGAPDTRMMHMFYPSFVHPRPALIKLQGAVQYAIDQETL
jgi:hypothetical protein